MNGFITRFTLQNAKLTHNPDEFFGNLTISRAKIRWSRSRLWPPWAAEISPKPLSAVLVLLFLWRDTNLEARRKERDLRHLIVVVGDDSGNDAALADLLERLVLQTVRKWFACFELSLGNVDLQPIDLYLGDNFENGRFAFSVFGDLGYVDLAISDLADRADELTGRRCIANNEEHCNRTQHLSHVSFLYFFASSGVTAHTATFFSHSKANTIRQQEEITLSDQI